MPRGYLKNIKGTEGKVALGGSSVRGHHHKSRKNCRLCNTWFRFTKSRYGILDGQKKRSALVSTGGEPQCFPCVGDKGAR